MNNVSKDELKEAVTALEAQYHVLTQFMNKYGGDDEHPINTVLQKRMANTLQMRDRLESVMKSHQMLVNTLQKVADDTSAELPGIHTYVTKTLAECNG